MMWLDCDVTPQLAGLEGFQRQSDGTQQLAFPGATLQLHAIVSWDCHPPTIPTSPYRLRSECRSSLNRVRELSVRDRDRESTLRDDSSSEFGVDTLRCHAHWPMSQVPSTKWGLPILRCIIVFRTRYRIYTVKEGYGNEWASSAVG